MEKAESHYYSRIQKSGFALAEVMVSLFIVTMVIVLIGALGKQIAQFGNSAKHTSSIVELRSRVSSLNNDPESWLDTLRSMNVSIGAYPSVGEFYSSCLPDGDVTHYNCPTVAENDNINPDNDKRLEELSKNMQGQNFAPIYDKRGSIIAGTDTSPYYLSLDGALCTPKSASDSSNCPIRAIGIFLRQFAGTSTDVDPGDVRFVVKVEKNPRADIGRFPNPFIAQYSTVDVNQQWKSSTASCLGSSVQIGYREGEPICINPLSSCSAGLIPIGLKADGTTACAASPCGVNEKAAVNASGTIECVSMSPCNAGEVFLGFLSGASGQPICYSTSTSCAANQFQVGITMDNGAAIPQCFNVPTSCPSGQEVIFNGNAFVCSSPTIVTSCPEGQSMRGIASDGSAICTTSSSSSSSVSSSITAVACPAGQVVTGFTATSSPICSAITSVMPECNFQGTKCSCHRNDVDPGKNLEDIASTVKHCLRCSGGVLQTGILVNLSNGGEKKTCDQMGMPAFY